MSDINTLMESLSKFNGKWPYQDAAEQLIKQQAEIISLREQVEKLTEAYDQCGRTVQDYGRTIGQTESRLREVATHCANVEQQLAALAEQNEKLTKERDTEIARNRPLQSLIKSTEETKSFLLKKSEENKEAVKQLDSERQANALLTEELAALAEQNEKLKDALRTVVDDSEECTDFDGWTAMLLSLDAYHIASTCLEETGIRARRNHG